MNLTCKNCGATFKISSNTRGRKPANCPTCVPIVKKQKQAAYSRAYNKTHKISTLVRAGYQKTYLQNVFKKPRRIYNDDLKYDVIKLITEKSKYISVSGVNFLNQKIQNSGKATDISRAILAYRDGAHKLPPISPKKPDTNHFSNYMQSKMVNWAIACNKNDGPAKDAIVEELFNLFTGKAKIVWCDDHGYQEFDF